MGTGERLSSPDINDFPASENNNGGGADRLEYHAPPEGLTGDVHEINLIIGNVLLETYASYFWLNRTKNLDSAKRTTSKLVERVKQLESMIYKLDPDALG